MVAAYPATREPDLAKVNQAVRAQLSAYKQPKQFLPVGGWPVSAAGKTRRGEVSRLVLARLKSAAR